MTTGQEVFHTHLHVLPRRPNDAVRVDIAYGSPPTRARLDATAARLCAFI